MVVKEQVEDWDLQMLCYTHCLSSSTDLLSILCPTHYTVHWQIQVFTSYLVEVSTMQFLGFIGVRGKPRPSGRGWIARRAKHAQSRFLSFLSYLYTS